MCLGSSNSGSISSHGYWLGLWLMPPDLRSLLSRGKASHHPSFELLGNNPCLIAEALGFQLHELTGHQQIQERLEKCSTIFHVCDSNSARLPVIWISRISQVACLFLLAFGQPICRIHRMKAKKKSTQSPGKLISLSRQCMTSDWVFSRLSISWRECVDIIDCQKVLSTWLVSLQCLQLRKISPGLKCGSLYVQSRRWRWSGRSLTG